MPSVEDALRGYAFPVHQRDNFRCSLGISTMQKSEACGSMDLPGMN